MQRDQAKFILQAYRRNAVPREGVPADVQEALETARDDPELSQFLEQEKAFDEAISEKLGEFRAPDGLLQQILSGSESSTSDPDSKVVSFSPEAAGTTVHRPASRLWSRVTPMAAAASVAIILSLSVFFFRTPVTAEMTPELASFVEDIGDYSHRLDGVVPQDSLADVEALLTSHGAPMARSLPEAVSSLKVFGCRPLEMDGITASMICFRGDEVFHLFVAERSHFPNQPDLEGVVHRECAGMNTATWTDGGQIYILATAGSKACIERIL